MKLKIGFLGIVLAFFLACSVGPGDDPSTNNATSGNNETGTGTVDDTAEALAVAARETTKQILAAQSDAAGFALVPATAGSFSEVDVTKNPLSAEDRRLQPYGTTTNTNSVAGECGGTLDSSTVTTVDDQTVFPMEINADWNYNNYCLENDDGNYWIRFNGSMFYYLQYTSQGNGTRHHYYDLSYTSNFPFLPSGTISYEKYCTIVGGVEHCNVGVYESETTVYYTEDVSVTGNASSGYDVSYILTDTAGHSYAAAFLDLIPCADGGISSGSGVVSLNDEEISIVFTDCGAYSVSYNGNTETF